MQQSNASTRTAVSHPRREESTTATRLAVHAVRDISGLTPTQKSVLYALASRANADQQCWPALRTIAADSGASPASVKRALISLEKRSLITREKRLLPDTRGHRSTLYTLRLSARAPTPKPPMELPHGEPTLAHREPRRTQGINTALNNHVIRTNNISCTGTSTRKGDSRARPRTRDESAMRPEAPVRAESASRPTVRQAKQLPDQQKEQARRPDAPARPARLSADAYQAGGDRQDERPEDLILTKAQLPRIIQLMRTRRLPENGYSLGAWAWASFFDQQRLHALEGCRPRVVALTRRRERRLEELMHRHGRESLARVVQYTANQRSTSGVKYGGKMAELDWLLAGDRYEKTLAWATQADNVAARREDEARRRREISGTRSGLVAIGTMFSSSTADER